MDATRIVSNTVLWMTLVSSIFAHTSLDMQRLVDDKMKFYNKKLRPVHLPNETTFTGIHFELIGIRDLEEVSGTFTVVGFLILGWIDELIRWDPKEYGGMQYFMAEGGDFWKPPIVLLNPQDRIDSVGSSWNIYNYAYDGVVSVGPGDVFKSSCSVDITFYPWDHQVCTLAFSPWGFNAKEVKLLPISDTVGTSFYFRNGQWDLVDTAVDWYIDSADAAVVVFQFNLRRKSRFVIVNVIIPIVFMSFLNVVVFLIPTESGERISYCLTVLLAIALFLSIVSDNLPKTSDPMSFLSYYLLGVLTTSVFIDFSTIISLRIYFRNEKMPVPRCLAVLAGCFGCKCRQGYRKNCRRHTNDTYNQNDLETIYSHKSHVKTGNGKDNCKRYMCENIDDNMDISCKAMEEIMKKTKARSASKSEGENRVTWKDVSFAFDIVCFVIFLCIVICATAVFFHIIWSSQSHEAENDNK